jgi:hypothetical protein
MTDRWSLRRWWTDSEDRFGLLLVLLIATVILSGVSDTDMAALLSGLLNVAAFVVGFRASHSTSRLWTIVGLTSGGIAGAILVATIRADDVGAAFGATIQVLLLCVLTLTVLGRVVNHKEVTGQTIMGAISAYLLIGQVFAWTYMALPGYVDEAVIEPARSGEIAVYYSFVVLTTLGFGDVTPVNALAERITVLEAVFGQMFLAILIARLVSMYSRDGR